MHQSFRRALLASILGLGVIAGLARADGHHQPPYYYYAQAYQPQALLVMPSPPPKFPWLHRTDAHPWSCWTHHNDLGCSSLKSTCAFMFGSCRTFFGEPCRRGPRPLPLPYDYGAFGPHANGAFGPYANGAAGCHGCR